MLPLRAKSPAVNDYYCGKELVSVTWPGEASRNRRVVLPAVLIESMCDEAKYVTNFKGARKERPRMCELHEAISLFFLYFFLRGFCKQCLV